MSSHVDPNPGMTPPLHDVDPELFERFLFDLLRLAQGWIQERLIGGVQTLVQKGLLNFFVANYF